MTVYTKCCGNFVRGLISYNSMCIHISSAPEMVGVF